MKTLGIALALIVACIVAGCDHGDQSGAAAAAPMRAPANVIVAPAITKDVPLYIEQIGKTAARESVVIQPQVGGKITAIHFKDGADLKKDDLLFTIDPRPYEAAVKQAEATLAENSADVKWSQSELKRVQGLAGTGAISAQEVESKQNAVAVAEAKVQAAQATLQNARLNLEYCTIKSPIEGRAGQRLVDVGNVVATGGADGGTKLLTIQRLNPIYADFSIPEHELSRVRQRMNQGALTTLVWLPSDPEQSPRQGELTFFDNAVADGSGTIKLRATLPNEDGHFWPGQFVKVRLVLSVLKDAVLVPAAAQQIGQQGPYVYVVKPNNTAELRPIQPGQRQAEMLAVLGGVAAGENVIVQGQMGVIPGGAVNVMPPATQPSQPAQPAPQPATQSTTQPAVAHGS